MREKYNIVLNSTFCYIIAFLATTFFHELAHAMLGKLFNSNPVLHHNYVVHFNYQSLETYQRVLTGLAGPVFSLIQGLFAGWFFLKSKKKTIFEMFLLWFSILGLFNFFGYIFSAPIFITGDIGNIYSILEIPFLQQIILSVISAGGLLYIAYKMTIPFISFSYKEKWVKTGFDRKNFSLHTLIIPWVIGSIAVTILYLPIIAIISIFYPIMSGFVFIYPWQNAQGAENFVLSQNEDIGSFSTRLTFVLIIAVLVFKIVLAAGIEF